MRRKLRAGLPAGITFTSDFHQLEAGDLRPGAPLLLRYDPLRIVPAGEAYVFGDPDRPITAHLRFLTDDRGLDVTLHSPAGVIACPRKTVTGQGSMLSARIDVPADADRVVIWFSFVTAAGAVVYDSAYGANYRFGFPAREITRVQATVSRHPTSPADRFEVAVTAATRVDAITVSYVLIADTACAKHELPLQRMDEAAGGQSLWRAADDVPHRAVVRFKLRYWIDGCQLVDDDAGVHYLAPAADPDRPPSPPPALLAAAAAWR